MKFFILIMASLLSTAALADDVCTKFIPCGIFQGSGRNFDRNGSPMKNGSYLEKIVISPNGENAADVEVFVYGKGNKPGDKGTYDMKATFTFAENGHFTTEKDVITGYCVNQACALTFKVWQNSDKMMTTNVNILRLDHGVLTRHMMASVSGAGPDYQRSRLVKIVEL